MSSASVPLRPLASAAQLVADIRQAVPEATAAWLYGSAAKGEMHSGSDVDIAVLLPPGNGHRTIDPLSAAALLALRWQRDVDLVSFRDVTPALQHEILLSNQRLFCIDALETELAELHAFSQFREFNERNALEFARISRSGRVTT